MSGSERSIRFCSNSENSGISDIGGLGIISNID